MANLFPTIEWANGRSIYEVNIRQYTREGTFNAFIPHLERLKDMGVGTLWLMPVTPISVLERQGTLGSYYACSSYTTINPEFGTLDDFKQLVKRAQSLGMKVIIDWVANHTGWDHYWATEHPDWYKHDEQGNFIEENGWKDVIDLNYASSALRAAMIEAMLYWVKECDIDGFRCDMAHLVPLDFWMEARPACDAVKPLFWLAECEVVKYHDVFDVSYAWWWMHITEKFFKGNALLNHAYEVLHDYSKYPKYSQKLLFTTNHDENSWNGTEYEKYGNAAKAMAVFTFTWRGVPLIYSGQESPNHKRLEFFNKDLIEWNEPPLLHGFYKTLNALHGSDAVTSGETFILPTHHEKSMAYLRRNGEEVILVILNLSDDKRVIIPVHHDWLQGTFTNVFSGIDFKFATGESFELQSYEYLVYHKKI